MAASEREQRAVAKRRGQAIMMRAAGMTYQQIADRLKDDDGNPVYKTASAAVQDVGRGLKAAADTSKAEAAHLLLMELNKLDLAEQTANQIRVAAMTGGDPDVALRALDRLLRIGGQRARLLPSLLGKDAAAAPEGDGAAEPQRIDQVARQRARRRNRFRAAAG